MNISNAATYAILAEQSLMRGDTPCARVNYSGAASAVLTEAKKTKSKDAEVYKLTAATYLFLAGSYDGAISIISKVRTKYLSGEEVSKLNDLFNECSLRKNTGYSKAISNQAAVYVKGNRWMDLLTLLRENPHEFTPVNLATMRRNACLKLGYTDVATLIEKDIISLRASYS